jgi:glycosyltransferase involved in cell wall biosynthesis
VVRRVAFAVPGELTIPTGGFAYDRRIIEELRELGWQVDVVNLGDGFPQPSERTRTAARALLTALPDNPIIVDGLAFGALPEVATELSANRDLIALVHHPLALEAGLTPDQAGALRTSERRALAAARSVIVTSAFTARLMVSDYDVPCNRVTVVRPGNDRVTPRRRDNNDNVDRKKELSLLAVGALVPRKGYDVLLAALAALTDLPWHLTIIGDHSRDVRTADRLTADLKRLGLAQRVTLTGVVSDQSLPTHYARADLFVLASRFEGYGMAFAEAIAHGLPVIGTNAGAIPNTVPAQASILVAPDDAPALSDALRQVMEDAALRHRLAIAAGAFAADLPTWRQSAELFSQALAAVA